MGLQERGLMAEQNRGSSGTPVPSLTLQNGRNAFESSQIHGWIRGRVLFADSHIHGVGHKQNAARMAPEL